MDEREDQFSAPDADRSVSDLSRENLQLKARIAELERLTAMDTLTPLFNRRYLMQELDRWCWRAHRYGGTFGLLYLDVDRLKSVNDTHGHAAGDAVLCGIAEALGSATRKSDVIARIGGDEFAILLDSITAEKLREKTASLRRHLTAFPVKTAGPVLKVNVSVGHCLIEGNSRASEVMIEADKSMYADKRSKYGEAAG
ncbi:GGDEF domain-containing protein [Sphingorhabdus buctiana]|uniref:diguanylate cyclase n=1 Tax=Sphingorhabdus buctiana TaxID=1508805 RepID=A0ABW4MB55_9SPHN